MVRNWPRPWGRPLPYQGLVKVGKQLQEVKGSPVGQADMNEADTSSSQLVYTE